MEKDKILIQLNDVSYKYQETDYLFKDIKLTIKEGDKTAIVGANGSGKSTLLKIIAGIIPLEEGTITVNCKPYYVPQIDLSVQQENSKIYEYITPYYEEWWEILPECEKLFGLELDAEAETKTLSGGELMKLNLTIALKNNPDVLILDEPTNHLDLNSIKRLIQFINEDFKDKYTYLIVSHDTYFLDQVVNNIWELENQKITAYGGNYTFFTEQKELRIRGLRRQYEIAQEKLEKAKELKLKEEERKAKKANEAKREFIKGSIDKRAFNEGKQAASTLQHGKSLMLERLEEEAQEMLEEYETESRKLAFIIMKNTADNRGRTILELKNANVTIDDKELINNINLKVTYGDRIVIAGNNGSGKTSLIKSLLKKSSDNGKHTKNSKAELNGETYIGKEFNWVYIDQSYSIVKPELNLYENLMAHHSSITESKAKEQLGKLQFKTEIELNKLGKHLSGGETVRLAMAMITAFPIDLLILDEPTNNLDVETVNVLVKSLNIFKGAIIVVSHNVNFLHAINVDTAYIIKNKQLRELKVDTLSRESLFKALG